VRLTFCATRESQPAIPAAHLIPSQPYLGIPSISLLALRLHKLALAANVAIEEAPESAAAHHRHCLSFRWAGCPSSFCAPFYIPTRYAVCRPPLKALGCSVSRDKEEIFSSDQPITDTRCRYFILTRRPRNYDVRPYARPRARSAVSWISIADDQPVGGAKIDTPMGYYFHARYLGRSSFRRRNLAYATPGV